MRIPFVDLKKQYEAIYVEVNATLQTMMQEATFVGGKYVQKFEEDFANFLGVKYFVGCANGTDAIEILLQAMEVGKGDEVIVPACSWVSTASAVSAVGAVPIFVDIEDDFYCINPKLIAEKITAKTKAIIPVHLYGQPADMPAIMEIAQKYNLYVLEDCAQAHGAEIQDKKVGTWGHGASFSFYPSKNLGAYGDAGGMATQMPEIEEKIRRIANLGQLKRHDHLIEGRNSRLDTLQAGVLALKLRYLPTWNERRISHAMLYQQLLGGKVRVPRIRENSKHVFHLYVIRSQYRDELQEQLSQKGVQTAIHYPQALPFLPCYAERGFHEKDFPVASLFQKEILSLPMFAELTPDQITYIYEILYNCSQL